MPYVVAVEVTGTGMVPAHTEDPAEAVRIVTEYVTALLTPRPLDVSTVRVTAVYQQGVPVDPSEYT
jgi:hypothetical protein